MTTCRRTGLERLAAVPGVEVLGCYGPRAQITADEEALAAVVADLGEVAVGGTGFDLTGLAVDSSGKV